MNELSQLLSQLPIAGAMVWFAYYIVNESRKERELWTAERKEMYGKISESHVKLSESIDKNTQALNRLLDNK